MVKSLSQVIHIAFQYLRGSPQNQTDGNKIEMREKEFEKREKELEASLDELKLQVKASKCKIEELTQKLEDKEEKLESLEDLNQTLIIKERRSNDELQEARKELVNQLKATGNTRASIRYKRMGELDSKPFQKECKKRFRGEEADVKATELCSLWEGNVRDSNWFPFVNIEVESNNYKEIINEITTWVMTFLKL
ncbi:hypothetical protein C5167_033142 [Papaver somniferum]|uniref:Factor of DNA methylation 1-5/IDN2 domain-containing protein n=1 Tax=Papaver somniferum TaxID=3469 RepID=A0A4Y7KB38_PAPSO|nr:hypothetical protein C5167_033142 [Papaver somniferum]